ncbi:MAG: PQQ-binding-like beta-propeller repeat protein [Gemmatimonadota bacterium]|nr:PQQ-binding-like beta-propeller repeat protein [Gemmatimonadota bacterium]
MSRAVSYSTRMLALGAFALFAGACGDATGGDRAEGVHVDGDWAVITGNLAGQRYSSLDQINPSNFAQLEVAWQYDASHLGSVNARSIPIYVDGMLINVHSEYRTVVATDAGTGEELWTYTEPETFRWAYSMRKNHGKGVAYANIDGRDVVFLISPAFFLHALDAHTGEHIEGFGGAVDIEGFPDTGVVDLLGPDGLGYDYEDAAEGIPLEVGYITSSSPALVVNGVVVVGNSAEQGYNQTRPENIPGDILGYDARTGDHLWKFNVLPGPGEVGHETWENDAWEWTGDISSWAPLSADPELGLVYVPTNGATQDYYGGFRPGDNLFSTSLIALDVETGERAWHYQLVHHDIWNYDTPQVPVLADVMIDGVQTPIIAQATKQAFLYVLNRATGEPIWPIEERPVPQSLVPGEHLAPTQPFPTKPAAYDMQGLTVDDLIDFTPELRQMAIEALEEFQIGPLFLPPLHRDNDLGKTAALWCPADVGGTNIDGTPAYDPETGIIYVPSQKGCSARILIPGPEKDPGGIVSDDRTQQPTGTRITEWVPGPSASPGRIDGLAFWKAPYSKITAIDLNTGEHLWWIPIGDTPRNVLEHPALQGQPDPRTGNGRQAALFTTPSMLVYAGTNSDNDPVLFAVDKMTGEEVGRVTMPDRNRYGLMTYMHGGKQYIVVNANGGNFALALPD